MSLILKGSQIPVLQLKWLVPNPRCQSKNTEMKLKTHIKLVQELHGICLYLKGIEDFNLEHWTGHVHVPWQEDVNGYCMSK